EGSGEGRRDYVENEVDGPVQEYVSEDDRGEESGEKTGQDERPERRTVPPDDDVIRKVRCGAEDECHPRDEDEKEHVRGAGEENRPRSCREGGRADEATDQRMTARGRKTPKPRDQVPSDRTGDAPHDDGNRMEESGIAQRQRIYAKDIRVDDPLANRLRDRVRDEDHPDEVPDRGHGDRLRRREDLR